MNPWILAIRPKTLTASLAPIVLGATLALSEGFMNIGLLSLIVMTALLIQIGTNLANDYFDFLKGVDTEERKGSIKVLQKGWITVGALRRATFMVFTGALLGSIYLIIKGGVPIALIASTSILFAITYTAGPFPLGHIGLADPIELLYFGPIAVGGTFYLLAGYFPLYVGLAGLIPGFLSLAILTVDNLRDYETDMKAGKKTLTVRFGKNFGKVQYYSCIFLGFSLPVILIALTKEHLYSLISFLALPLYKNCLDAVRDNENAESLNKTLAQTALNLIVFVLIFCAGWLL
jgi:1,4-dihydroxy-2-naphthoate octaprenyltransferase